MIIRVGLNVWVLNPFNALDNVQFKANARCIRFKPRIKSFHRIFSLSALNGFAHFADPTALREERTVAFEEPWPRWFPGTIKDAYVKYTFCIST